MGKFVLLVTLLRSRILLLGLRLKFVDKADGEVALVEPIVCSQRKNRIFSLTAKRVGGYVIYSIFSSILPCA